MDGVREFLDELKGQGPAQGNFLGVLNVLIGRRITTKDGGLISAGLTWRELAALLKKVRWDKDATGDLGLDPGRLPPRDRERYWYAVITQAQVDSEAATRAGDRLAAALAKKGYTVGPAPGQQKPAESKGSRSSRKS